MVRRIFVGVVVAAAMAAPMAQAGEEEYAVGPALQSPQRIPGLEVAQQDFPEHATVLTRAEIERSGAASLLELLQQQAGVTVLDSRGMGLGADSGVGLRGLSNGSRSNVLVLVNGIRKNRITGDEVHWQGMPLSQIERVEILRGGGGTIYGEGALAGVINIVTRSGGQRSAQTEDSVEVGSYGWQQYVTSVFGRSGPGEYALSYTRQLWDGYRDSTAMRGTNIIANAGVQVGDQLRLRAHVLHGDDTSHFAGGLTAQQAEMNRRHPGAFFGFFEDEITQVGLEQQWSADGGFTFLLSEYWRGRVNDSVTSARFFTTTGSRGVSLRLAHEASEERLAHTLMAGLELGQDKATTGSRGSPSLAESNRTNIGLYVEETLLLWDRLYPSVPALAGGQTWTQFFWFGPNSPSPPCPPSGVSASNALAIVVQP